MTRNNPPSLFGVRSKTLPQTSAARFARPHRYELYRPNATTNCTLQLDACLGVATGQAIDECSNPGPGVAPLYNPWFPYIFQDSDLGPGRNVAIWPPSVPLMSQRVFPLAIGGGFYWSNSAGTAPATIFPFTGQLFSVAIWRRHLNLTERAAVQNYLGARYGLWCSALSPANAPPADVSGCLATSMAARASSTAARASCARAAPST